ncbi:hypothetical protein C0Q70_09475 [Pomacea canaliculata]|uniref:AMP-dependent synthetase/ligase domain-containing protein n=1 Tax=Pomacea canaliculata TaxID=400727 RepID=A0A2T7P9X3_POMCA|nr:hypothetical protein C0Q70_09475 [Pomacea canaliculata]
MKLGLKQGAALCVVSRNSVEFVLLILGTYAIGAFVHTPNPLSMPDELRRQIELSEAKHVVTTPEFIASVQEAVKDTDTKIIIVGPRDGNLNFSDILALGSEDVLLPPAPVDPRTAIASLLFSSGTTGLPKGVIITQRNIMAWVHQFNAHDGPLLSTDDTTVLFLQLFHAYGQVVALSASLAYGCRVVLVTKFEINEFLSFVAKYRATFLFVVPPVIIAMVNHPKLSTYDLSSVRQAMSAAAPLGKELEIQLSQKMGRTFLVQGYGMTENMAVTLRSLRHQLPGSCGRLLPNTQAKVCAVQRHLSNQSFTECRLPEKSDVARIDADGFMYILDRLKELIKFKGEQVPPAMLEDILLNHPNIADACVIGKPDLEAGELPRAYVVPVEGAKLSEKEVIDYVARTKANDSEGAPILQIHSGRHAVRNAKLTQGKR